MAEQSIGEQELALLRHIADRGSLTVGEAAEEFGAPARPRAVDGADDDGAAAREGAPRAAAGRRRLSLSRAGFVGRSDEGRGPAVRRTQPRWIGVAVSGLPVRSRTASRTPSSRNSKRSWPGSTPTAERTGDRSWSRPLRALRSTARSWSRSSGLVSAPPAPPAGHPHGALVVRGGQVRGGAGVDDADRHPDSARAGAAGRSQSPCDVAADPRPAG